MAVTVSCKNYSLIDDCSDYTTWNGETPANVTDFYKEGSSCVGFTVRGDGANDIYLDTGSWNLSGKHLHFWMMTTALKELLSEASNGIQVVLGDGTNTAYYTVGGGDTYPGGWWNVVLDCDRSPTSGSQPTLTAITYIGIRFNHTGSAKNNQNTWIDHVYTGDGLIAYGDDGGGYFDFDDILAVDQDTTYGWGVITKFGGVYFTIGSITIGDASGSSATKFNPKSSILIFENRPVDAALYSVEVVDNGTGTTEFILGDKSGTKGIQGCIFRVQTPSQSAKFSLDAKTDSDVDYFKLYASVFYGGSTFGFPSGGVNVEVIGCSFESCGQVDPSSCDLRDCLFINTSDADAALLWNESIDINTCYFIANTVGAAIEHPSAAGSPYAYNALKFSGNTYDVLNSSGSAISINKNNGSDPTSYEGSLVTFLGVSVDIVITVRDVVSFGLIENARVLLEAADGSGDLYFNQAVIQITRSGTTATVNHTSHGLSTGAWVHVQGCDQLEYNIAAQITYVDANNYSYQVSGTPASPATGSPTVTGVVFNHLTSALGKVSDTRSWTVNQNLVGKVRRSTSSPLYQSQPIVETADKDNGLSVTVYLIPDE